MPNKLSISVTNLNKANECPRCFWVSEKVGAQPSIFPGVLSRIDRLIKRFMERNAFNPPHWFPVKGRFLGATDTLEALDEGSGITLKGRLDALVETNKGYWVIDYKTGRPKSHVPDYYQTQLDGYAFLVEKNKGKVVGGGLLYFYPKRGYQAELAQERMLIDIAWVEASVKAENIKPLLRRARKILDELSPPAPSNECNMCKWLGEAGYRYQEFVDKLPRKTQEKAKRYMRLDELG